MQLRISRKEFLRMLALTAVGGVAAACGLQDLKTVSLETNPAPSPSSLPPVGQTPPPTATAPVKVTLTGGDGDVWAWDALVNGTTTKPSDCQGVDIILNGQNYSAVQNEGDFSASVLLDQGENHILAYCKLPGGQMVVSNPLTYSVALRRGPKAIPQVAIKDDHLILNGSSSQADEQDKATLVDFIWSARQSNPASMQVIGNDGLPQRDFTGEISGDRIEVSLPPVDGEYYFSLRTVDRKGRSDIGSTYVEVVSGKARIPNYDKENPAWVETAIVYGVIPRKFGVHGFAGIISRLDDLAELGINALWLSPINVSPASDYGYAIVDYFNLNPSYGTKEEFHRLVQEAHYRGIRVLMDFVPNHSSIEHPYFQEAEKLGQGSRYWEFYDRDKNGQPTHYFNWDYLPNLNYHNPEVRTWMTEAFSYWVREFDVDGFRVDASWGVKERRPDYWPEWRRKLKRIKPDLLLLAEASARDPYYFDNGFDAGYDWTDQLGKWAWEHVWDTYKNRQLVYNLDTALTNRASGGYHPDAQVFRFLNNNDTGDRFITQWGEGMARVATALLLSLPGIPCIYTGDEIGAEFRPYENPEPLDWQEKYPGMRAYHQKLIALRKNLPALHSRQWSRLEINPTPQALFGYLRPGATPTESALVLLNFSEEASEAEFQLPEGFRVSSAGLVDQLSGEHIAASGNKVLKIPLNGLTARILTSA